RPSRRAKTSYSAPAGPDRTRTDVMPTRQPFSPEASPPTPAAEGGRFHRTRSHASRYCALDDEHGLVTITVYKQGAEAAQDTWRPMPAPSRIGSARSPT